MFHPFGRFPPPSFPSPSGFLARRTTHGTATLLSSPRSASQPRG